MAHRFESLFFWRMVGCREVMIPKQHRSGFFRDPPCRSHLHSYKALDIFPQVALKFAHYASRHT